MTKMCEWDRDRDEPARHLKGRKGEYLGCPRPAAVVISQKDVWYLCEQCAARPRFALLKHTPLKGRTGP